MSEVKPTTKPPISLIPPEAIIETAKAFQFGASKHGKYGFRDGVEFSKLIDAGFRHLLQITEGEDVDDESKCLHAASVIANMSMLIWMMKHRKDMDDRFNKPESSETVNLTSPKGLSDEQWQKLKEEFAPPAEIGQMMISSQGIKCRKCERGDSHICDHPRQYEYYKDSVMAGSKKK